MKKKLFIILGVFVVNISLVLFFTLKKEDNNVISKEETVEMGNLPSGIMAYTVNGEKTSLSYEYLLNNNTVNKITCKNGTVATFNTSDNSVSLSNIKMPDYCTIDFNHTFYSKLLADNPKVETRTDFSTIFTTTNTGTLYKATESIAGGTAKDVYYFAGDAKNNWVKFANFYWRIIRTNADGSIRLLYSGTATDTTSGYIGTSYFNNTHNDSMYVGYMYGTSGTLASNRTNENDSTIKTYIDNWYSTNLSSYTKYISTEAVYCNDRQLDNGQSWTFTTSPSSQMNYITFSRLDWNGDGANANPTYNCANKKDAFSGSNSEAKLTYPIGLMTADEINIAGGLIFNNAPTYYYLNSAGGSITGTYYWWSLSPMGWSGDDSRVWRVVGSDSPGGLGYGNVNDSGGVRPAISLKGNLVWKSGNGSSASPYEVEDLPPTLSETIKSYATSHTNGVYNENGYRYEGTDPSNYIYMTNKSTNEKELWRIIGVFNDGANGEEVIRVRRHYEKNSYPTMAYDSNSTNYFPNTTMYNTLSSTYNLNNYSHTVNFKMYLGTSDSFNTLTSSGWYTTERGTTPGKTAADSYNNSVSFIGGAGLMYPSDYGYAVLASDCPRTKELFNLDETCYNNNWLFQGNNQHQRLISPSASAANGAFYVTSLGGDVRPHRVTNALASSPVMSLESGIMVEGTGTKSDPYVITN